MSPVFLSSVFLTPFLLPLFQIVKEILQKYAQFPTSFYTCLGLDYGN